MSDAKSRTLYQKVADDLRAQIASGELPIGAQIPSTAELGRHYGVSATAARNAVTVLDKEGLIERIPGKGVFVRATPEAVEEERATLKAVGSEVAELREEVRQLAVAQPAEVLEKVEELRTEVGQLEAHLRLLYDRLGQPYPNPQGQSDSKQKRRRTGA